MSALPPSRSAAEEEFAASSSSEDEGAADDGFATVPLPAPPGQPHEGEEQEDEEETKVRGPSFPSTSEDSAASATAADLVDGRTIDEWAEIEAAVRGGDLDFAHPRELAALAELRSRHPVATDPFFEDDRLSLIFLFARKLDVKRTAFLMNSHLEWRRQAGLGRRPVGADDVPREALDARFLVDTHGRRDAGGRAVSYFFPARYRPDALPAGALERLLAYQFERRVAEERLDGWRRGVTYVQDLGGAGFSNLDRKAAKRVMSATQNCFPLRIHAILTVRGGVVFRAMLALARLFLKSKLVARIECVSFEELHARVPRRDLLKELGGLLPPAPREASSAANSAPPPGAACAAPSAASAIEESRDAEEDAGGSVAA